MVRCMRLDVEVEREIPVGVGAFEHGAVVDEAGAVEQDVDRADLPRQRVDGLGRADVERVGSAPSRPASLPLSRSVAITRRALGQEGFRRGAADALPRRRQETPSCPATVPATFAPPRFSVRSRRKSRQGPVAAGLGIEILRREPCLEGPLDRRPFGIQHGEPGRVAVAALDDHVLPEHALEGEAEPFGGALAMAR